MGYNRKPEPSGDARGCTGGTVPPPPKIFPTHTGSHVPNIRVSQAVVHQRNISDLYAFDSYVMISVPLGGIVFSGDAREGHRRDFAPQKFKNKLFPGPPVILTCKITLYKIYCELEYLWFNHFVL